MVPADRRQSLALQERQLARVRTGRELGDSASVDDRDVESLPCEHQRGRQAGEPCTDDDHVVPDVRFEG